VAEDLENEDKTPDKKDVLAAWVKRKDEAEKDRSQYLTQIKVNRKVAAGKQHLDVNIKDGRVLDVQKRDGVRLVTSDILDQYLKTAIGKMAANDYRPNFLVYSDNAQGETITKQLNLAFAWGWDNEWNADKKILQLWRLLVVDGTAAIRCRYDRRFGEVIGDFPYKNGKPITDKDEAVRYVADEAKEGRTAKIKKLRTGRIVWELLTVENLLPPPGYDDPAEFPWEIVVRPVPVEEVKKRWPESSDDIEPEDIESSAALTAGLGIGESKSEILEDRVLVYTGYMRPNTDHPKGQTVIFTDGVLLETHNALPYADHPRGPSTGLHYFRWGVIPGRFMGKGFIENGIGPQIVRNKRITQIDAIIDRNMPKVYIEESSLARPKTGEPMEYVEVRSGAPLPKTEAGVPPGAWMLADVKLQEENAERAMGMRSVSLGAPPQGVTAYSALALLNENNSLQFDAIGQDFRLVMLDLSWDTVEAMKNWPPGKQLLIAGPEGRLTAVLWERNNVDVQYLARPPRGGTLPRSQAAELQKVNDIFGVIRQSPLFARNPEQWVNWYIDSLNAGKPQDLPPSIGDQQAHKAELENIAMTKTGEPVPVAEYDDDIRHVEIHRAFQIPLRALMDEGDEDSGRQVEVLEMHIREHMASAEREAAAINPPQPGTGIPAGPQQAPPPGPSGGGSAVPSIQSLLGAEAAAGPPA
jgi:hypothetical protein